MEYVGSVAALPDSLFRNQGDGHFEDVSKTAGADFQLAGQYRGVAFADFDNDGQLDAVVSNVNGPARQPLHHERGLRIVKRTAGALWAGRTSACQANPDSLAQRAGSGYSRC